MSLIGLIWAVLAPLSIAAAAGLLAWGIRRVAPARFGWPGAVGLAALVVCVPTAVVWRQDMAAFEALCRAEGAAIVHEKARADGILLTSDTSNSFGMRYLHQEGFAWMESNNIYKRGGFVRYTRDEKGAIAIAEIDVPTARYEVRETFEQNAIASFSRTAIIDRDTGREMARAASGAFRGGRLAAVLGGWGAAACPSAPTAPDAFNAWYHLARDTLR